MYKLKKIKDVKQKEKVKVIGKVLEIESKPYKSGKGETVKIIISDLDDSIQCIFFLNKKPYNQYLENKSKFEDIKVGDGVIIEGETKMDDTYHKVKVSSIGVNVTVPTIQIIIHTLESFNVEKRKDEASEKRVEFQVVTKYTTQQSIVDINDLFELVGENRFGHKAVAITDKATVHSFPYVEKLIKDKKLNTKVMYGSEFKVAYGSASPIINGVPSEIDIKDLELIFFDLETKGYNPIFDDIIEGGAIKVKNWKIIDEFQMLVKPSKPISEKITELTGITNEMVKDSENELTFLNKFKEFVGDGILIGHNVKFDYSFIQQKCKKYNTTFNFDSNLVIDTLMLTKLLFENLQQTSKKRLTLDSLLKHFGKKIEEHHRAKEDSISTYLLFNFLINGIEREKKKEVIKEKGIFDFGYRNFKELNDFSSNIPNNRSWSRILVYAKNQKGLKSLYELVSKANVDNVDTKVIHFSEIEKRKDNLVLISDGYYADNIYDELLKGNVKIEDWKKYDAIGIHSYTQNCNFKDLNENQIKTINKLILKLAKENNIKVIALGNVHYLHQFEEKYHNVIVNEAKRNNNPIIDKDEKSNAYFRTTNEMIEEFSYLGKEIAKEIVVTNTVSLVDVFEEIEIIPKKLHIPHLDEVDEKISTMVWDKARKLFGERIPKLIKDRLEDELQKIINGGFSVNYYVAHLTVKRSLENGYLVGSRGSVGSSSVANYCDITEVNPLSPHYYCPKCKIVEWRDDVESGYDLDTKKCECGEIMIGDGQGIPFEMFVGADPIKIKTPDIDLNFSNEYQLKSHDHVREIFGEENVIRAGTVGTYADGKSDKATWDYFKEFGKKQEFSLEELYNNTSNFYKFDKNSGTYKKTPFIYSTTNKVFIEELKEKGTKGNKEKKVERISFNIKDSYLKEFKKYINDVKYSTGQHAGGLMIIPNDMSVEDFFPISYASDGKEKNVITSHMDYKPYEDSLLKLDLLGHLDPTRLYYLEKETKIIPLTIPLNNKDVITEFRKGNTQRISEFNTSFSTKVTIESNPQSYSDLVRISGLTHGTGVWIDNADKLINEEGKSIREVIACREDMLSFLKKNGMDFGIAFRMVEKVRKGKGVTKEEEEMMLSNGVPQWYIDSMKKIEYLFPKAHAVAYVNNAIRLMWYKLHYPIQFTKVMLDMQVDGSKIDFLPILKPYNEFKEYMRDLEERDSNYKATNKEKDSLADYHLVEYYKSLGYEILPVDFNKSDVEKFIYEDNKAIRMPLSIIPKLNDKHIKNILESRKEKTFTNIDEVVEILGIKKESKELINNISNYCGWEN